MLFISSPQTHQQLLLVTQICSMKRNISLNTKLFYSIQQAATNSNIFNLFNGKQNVLH